MDREGSGAGGLRAQKKRRTRKEILRVASAMFEQRGYHATTVADIAAAADISTRTFFSYFPSKDDLLLGPYRERLDAFPALLAARGPGTSALTVLHAWTTTLFVDDTAVGDDEELVDVLGGARDVDFAAAEARVMAELEGHLTRALTDDLGGDALLARMAAAAALAAIASMDLLFADRSPAAVRKRRANELLAQVDLFVRAGLDAVVARRGGAGRDPAGSLPTGS